MRYIGHDEKAADITPAEQQGYADYCAQAYAGYGISPYAMLTIDTYVLRLREAQARERQAKLIEGTYSSGRKYYTVECGECHVVLNSGHHYGPLHIHFAYELAEQHNAEHHGATS